MPTVPLIYICIAMGVASCVFPTRPFSNEHVRCNTLQRQRETKWLPHESVKYLLRERQLCKTFMTCMKIDVEIHVLE